MAIFFLILSFFVQNSSSQEKNFVYKKGDSICTVNKNNQNFKRAVSYFKERKFDSSYVYSSLSIISASNQDVKDYFLYLKAYSAYVKGLYLQSVLCLDSISDNNPDYTSRKILLLASTYINLEKYDSAISVLEKYLKNHNTGKKKDKKFVYHNLGVSYLLMKKFDKATYYFNKEKLLLNKIDTTSQINIRTSLGSLYLSLNHKRKAHSLFKEAYDLTKSYNDITLKRDLANNMAVAEKSLGNLAQSILYYEEYNRWKDSIWNRDKIWELTEKDKQLAVAQKQQEIAVQDEQIKRQKVVQKGLLLGASGLLVFIGGLGYFYRKLKKQKQLITEQKEELDIANKTKNYLFSVVSHDLRSPINTIKRQHKKLAKHIANNDLSAIKEANQQAISVTDSTSHLLNNVLQWSLEQSNQLNFSQEDYALHPIIEHILFDYEDVAESNDISIATNFTEDITVKTDKESLKIVLRNLIDNAIKYMNGAGSIEITTTTQNNQARIELKDSGIGISEEKLQKINALKDLSVDKIDRSKGVGLGLILCQTLIKKNNGTLFFESVEGKSTTAIVLLPLV